MIEVIRVARTVSGTRTAVDQIPDPGTVRLLQVAAFEAEGLPRLISDLMACYTETSCQEETGLGFSGYRFLDHDLRLTRAVGRTTGFRSGPDMRWTVGCIGELADYGRLVDSSTADLWPTAWRGGFGSGEVLLHRLGQRHLVCGRLNPAQLRAASARPLAQLPSARLRSGTVRVLSAISGDAAAEDSAWTESSLALSRLGMTRGRAAQLFSAVGPLIIRPAREMRVSRTAETTDLEERVPSVGESAGVVLAMCDLIAISSLCGEQ